MRIDLYRKNNTDTDDVYTNSGVFDCSTFECNEETEKKVY